MEGRDVSSRDIAQAAYDRRANQRVSELAWLLDKFVELAPKRILEIGSQDGGTLYAWSQIAPEAQIVSVDLDGRAVIPKKCAVNIGDSHNPHVVESVRALSPYDFAFIDGDHTTEGVLADWENYGPMVTGLVAFHDIDMQTREAWEIVKQGRRTEEFVDPDEPSMGIGCVWMP